MSKRAPLVVVDSLSRDYDRGAVHALAGVSFAAEAGEVVAVTGASGCGKSTLLSLIGLLDTPTTGSVHIGGFDTASVRDRAAFRGRHIGFVFQFHHLVPTMTLAENVAAPMIPLRVKRRERRERAHAILGDMGVAHRARFLPAHVSGGERQRAAVARALVNRPPVILADEPTGNLDSANSELVMGLLVTHARAHGALVIVATHNPDVAAVADRRLALHDGRLVAASPIVLPDTGRVRALSVR